MIIMSVNKLFKLKLNIVKNLNAILSWKKQVLKYGIFLLILWSNLQILNAQSYCVQPPSPLPWQQWIARVELNTLDNSSEKCDNGCGLSDFTNLSTTLTKGTNYNITLTAGLGWANPNADLFWQVWIDLNDDGDFDDAGENLASTSGNGSLSSNPPTEVHTAGFTIPTSAQNGSKRMRIALKKGDYADPCEVSYPGEVEDYTVNIEGGSTGGCNGFNINPRNLSVTANSQVFDIIVNNPGNESLTISTEPSNQTWANPQIINNNTVQVTVASNTNQNVSFREVAIIISACGENYYCDLMQTAPAPADIGWPNPDAGLGKLANEIPIGTNTPSPYTYGEMIGVNIRSQAMNNVYEGGPTSVLPDEYITELSSHVRSFHHHEKDYINGAAPNEALPLGITEDGFFTVPPEVPNNSGTINKLYKVWKNDWKNKGLDIDIIATLVNAGTTGNNPTVFPNKWWLENQWGANPTEIYNNAKIYGEAFAETACPPGEECLVDMLEVGNEPWGYENPETFKIVYRGIVDGVKTYFNEDDIELWPMGVMPGAFQAFRVEGQIGTTSGGGPVYDQLGRRLPHDRKDYILGVGLHPYGFVNDEPNKRRWQYNINEGLSKEPEHPFSLFQFLKNGVYWRNVNLPDKEAGSTTRFKAKIYASEFGYGSEDRNGFPGVGELTQAMYNLRSILIMGRLGVYRASIYEGWDHDDGGYYGYGLYTEGGGSNGEGPLNPKPHYNTLKNFKTLLGNNRYLQAIHDGETIGNAERLYVYVMGDANGNPTHLVVWNGVGMDYQLGTANVTTQRNALTANGGTASVTIDLAAIQGNTVNTNGALWLHDVENSSYNSSNFSVNGNTLNMNVSPIPVMIPLNGGACPSCNDGIQNCDETGVDCGGSCPNSCSPFGACQQLTLAPNMFFFADGSSASASGDAGSLADEQSLMGDPINGNGAPINSSNPPFFNVDWTTPWSPNQVAYVDLGQAYDISSIHLLDGAGDGQFTVALGLPSDGNIPFIDFITDTYGQWVDYENLQITSTRYLTFEKVVGTSRINEIAICGTPSGSSGNCFDGILNGDETGVDCGGSCPTTCTTNMCDNTIDVCGIAMTFSGLEVTFESGSASSGSVLNIQLYQVGPTGWNGPYQLCNDWNPTNACVTGESVTLPAAGEYAVSVQGRDNCNTVFVDVVDCMASMSSEVLEIEKTPFKITRLSPNPATDQILVELNSDQLMNLQVGIMNAQGKTVLRSSETVDEGHNHLSFSIKNLSAGIYYLYIEGFKGKKEALKFVKIKM